MKHHEVKVTFQPGGRSVYVLPGTIVLEAAGRAGIILQTPCGGKGTCGKCKVKVVNGQCTPSAASREVFPDSKIREGFRLACQSRVESPLAVEIPPESCFEAAGRVLTGDSGQTTALNPAVTKRFFCIKDNAGDEQDSDVARLKRAAGDVEIPFHLLKKLPGFLRAHQWKGTAVVLDNRLMTLESGDTSDTLYGVAVDLGTTTMVATLFDLASGHEAAVASSMNPQAGYGDDVISRISGVRENHGLLREMQRAVVNGIDKLIRELAGQSGVAVKHIYEIVIVGNSTMQQIFCGLDPSALGGIPFSPVFDDPLTIPASTVGMIAHPEANIFVFPQIGGFVGGDTVAGILASRMEDSDGARLLIDIGTNGEIVLSCDGRLLATSTAAGPAFEGARITQGMRAAEGAIEKVVIRDEVMINVIGDTAPAGLCGTALIDAVAELLRLGIIDKTGRILPEDEVPGDTPPSLRSLIVSENGRTKFLLVDADDAAYGEPIYLWQKDVREVQLATGAIRAGIQILLKRAGLKPGDLEEVLLAGAFGNFIRRKNALRIGLLPRIPRDRIRFIGNAASLGAKMALLSAEERKRASELSKKTEHVDLSLDVEFQKQFGMGMMFPAHEADACSD